jgi:hypothetical protein
MQIKAAVVRLQLAVDKGGEAGQVRLRGPLIDKTLMACQEIHDSSLSRKSCVSEGDRAMNESDPALAIERPAGLPGGHDTGSVSSS